MQKVVVLGASGSIGKSAASVLAANPDRYSVYALAAKNNLDELSRQCDLLHPEVVITASEKKFPELQQKIGSKAVVACGMEAMLEAVTHPEVDVVLCAIIGTSGILPVLAALKAGKKVALASKEVLVLAGELVMRACADSSGSMVPVDSEHSGVFQCLAGYKRDELRKVWLTASGGPFRTWTSERIRQAALEEALAHPTWQMGRKITIDSASMMNKAMELIEARYLFDLQPEQLDVVINPQSVVHALAELSDGSMLAQLSVPDMRLCIQYALTYPDRMPSLLEPLDLKKIGRLTFAEPDEKTFTLLPLARRAVREGGTKTAVLNGANDAAVALFLDNKIGFTDLFDVVEAVVNGTASVQNPTTDDIEDAIRMAKDAVIRMLR